MGDDTPVAVLSDQYRPLSHFFRQNFSQVTNPPIDSLREHRVMSLKTRFGNLKNVLEQSSSQTEILTLESPVVSNGQFAAMKEAFKDQVAEIDCPSSPAARTTCCARSWSASAMRPNRPYAPAPPISS